MAYDVGTFIGCGYYNYFFRLKKYSNLGVRVRRRDTGLIAYFKLNNELRKARVLRRLGISVPRYINVVRVKFPECTAETIKNIDAPDEVIKELMDKSSITYYGLIIEYIEGDLKMVEKSKVQDLYDLEKKKIDKHPNIQMDHTGITKVLWSEREQKIYFIDFDAWTIL
jgi:hypothetical protein